MKNINAKYRNSIEKTPWRKAITYFVILIICNLLCMKLSFVTDKKRFIEIIAFLVGLYSLFQLSAKLSGILTHRYFSFWDITSEVALKKDSQLAKGAGLAILFLLLFFGIHFFGYRQYFKYQKEQLEENGVNVKTIVTKKIWDKRGKNSPAQHYIYYTYRYKNKVYHQNSASELYEAGDTIKIKLLPDNPDNHRIIESK